MKEFNPISLVSPENSRRDIQVVSDTRHFDLSDIFYLKAGLWYQTPGSIRHIYLDVGLWYQTLGSIRHNLPWSLSLIPDTSIYQTYFTVKLVSDTRHLDLYDIFILMFVSDTRNWDLSDIFTLKLVSDTRHLDLSDIFYLKAGLWYQKLGSIKHNLPCSWSLIPDTWIYQTCLPWSWSLIPDPWIYQT